MTGVLKIEASETTTLNLNAELGGITATITNFRVRLMEFGSADPLGGNPPEPGQEGWTAMYMNTTEYSDACPDGCKYAARVG